MIRNLLTKIEKSLHVFNDREILSLFNKTNTEVYTSIHKAILNINDIDTNSIINEIKEKHINEIEHKNCEIDDVKTKYLQEIEMKNKEIFELNNNLNEKINHHTELLKNQYNNEIEFFKEQNRDIKEDFNSQISYLQQQLQDKECFIDTTLNNLLNKNNKQKGDYGENLVYNALNENPKYNDIQIIDVSNIKGNGDINVKIPSLDLSIMIECKNETEVKTDTDIAQFDIHRNEFFNQNPSSHAIMFSIGCNRIPNYSSYSIVNNDNNFTGYFSKKNMNKDEIIYYFYNFIDQIITHKNNLNQTSKNTELCDSINNNNILFNNILNDYKEKHKYHEEQLKYYNNMIKEINTIVPTNEQILIEQGYTQCTHTIINSKVNKINKLNTFLKQNDIDNVNTTLNDFMKKIRKKSKYNDDFKKETLLKKFKLPLKMTYKELHDNI